MIQLILVRHAKSDWGNPGLADHDRPLNQRGQANAPMMADRLLAAGVTVDQIHSSTAVRARTTAEVFGAALGEMVQLDPGMYLASGSALLAKAAEAGARSVMLVAHDPGITDLAARLSDGGITHMPTCAVARFAWNAQDWDAERWADVGTRSADKWSLDTVNPKHPRLPQTVRRSRGALPRH